MGNNTFLIHTEVLQRLEDIREDEAELLVAAWHSMPCRNADLVEFNSTLTGLVRCNTAPLLLGAGQAAKAAVSIVLLQVCFRIWS